MPLWRKDRASGGSRLAGAQASGCGIGISRAVTARAVQELSATSRAWDIFAKRARVSVICSHAGGQAALKVVL